MNEIFVLHYKEELLHNSEKWKEYAKKQKKSWYSPRLSKRVYFREQDAKLGLQNVPAKFRKDIEIVKYKTSRLNYFYNSIKFAYLSNKKYVNDSAIYEQMICDGIEMIKYSITKL